MISRLQLQGWRQFKSIDIRFHPRLTVLTGANGAGKTSLLNLVSRHFGWPSGFVSTPKLSNRSSTPSYSADYWDLTDDDDNTNAGFSKNLDPVSPRIVGPLIRIGSIEYVGGDQSPVLVPEASVGSTYDVQIPQQRALEGLHIPSHRPTYSYQQVQHIPTVPRRRAEVFSQYSNLVRQKFMGQHVQWSPHYYLKETLIALAVFGYGNSAVEADAESAKLFEGFQDVLRRMLPPTLGFTRLVVRAPEVILETATGPFSLDALSGGAAAVVDLAWQIYMFLASGSSFVVTLDEPENHLHPELQRRVLADLIASFPTVQFIVATHSPFVVGSVPESNVYVLNYDEESRVNSTLLDTVNKAGTANEILRDVLGLDFTLPIWVESQLSELVARYSAVEFTNENVNILRADLKRLGMSHLIPATIAKIAEAKDAQ